MPEKYDFSKARDQKSFDKLSNKEQKNIIDKAETDAREIKALGDNRDMDYASAEKQIIAKKHWLNGHLGVTAEDHMEIGGSPDLELYRNPGKTLGELWSVEKIQENLEKTSEFLDKSRKEYAGKDPRSPDSHWPKDNIVYAKKELRATINYLRSIGKLPGKFENFEVEDLDSDPKQ